MSNPYSQEEKKPGLLDGLSISQVVAGALAAVTSVALSSQIGIAGSIIGVAVASVVSTVASQLYRGMLTRSADKLRELRSTSDEIAEPRLDQIGASTTDTKVSAASSTTAMAASSTTKLTPDSDDHSAQEPRIAPATLRARAAQRRQDALRRKITIAAIISSLIAVVLVALIITFATGGQGIGEKVSVIGAPAEPSATTTAPTQSEPETPATTSDAQTEEATTTTATTETSTEAATTESTTTDAAIAPATEAATTDASANDTSTNEPQTQEAQETTSAE